MEENPDNLKIPISENEVRILIKELLLNTYPQYNYYVINLKKLWRNPLIESLRFRILKYENTNDIGVIIFIIKQHPSIFNLFGFSYRGDGCYFKNKVVFFTT